MTRTVNIYEAKTHLSSLIDQAMRGEPFVIARAGKPLVVVTRLNVKEKSSSGRIGFLAGEIEVPEDFDQMGQNEIQRLFGGSE